MIYTTEVQHMCPVAKGAYHGPAPIPEEGKWVQAKQIADISGFTHGIGWCAPQQGAGFVVTKSDEKKETACVEFLKWFTQPEHNISFSVDSGYLPVTTAANDMEAIKTSGLELSPKMERILSNAVQSVKNNTLYTPSAFVGGSKARKVLEYSLSDLASADRATVQERVAAGQPAADAEAEFLTDEYFDAWYGGICTALEEYAG